MTKRIKPWDTEPDYIKWIDGATGYHCVMKRNHFGAWCGYVRVHRRHQFYKRKYNGKVERVIEAHGGITFSGNLKRHTGGMLRGWWLGFDCSHCMIDLSPKMEDMYNNAGILADSLAVYRDVAYVQSEIRSMAAQLSAMQ